MGNAFAVEQVADTSTNQAQSQAGSGETLFNRLHSGFDHFLHKAQSAGEQIQHSQAFNEAQQYGRNIGNQLRDQADQTIGSAERVANGQGTAADRQRLETIGKGALMLTGPGQLVGAANLAERSGALNQAAGVLERSGILGRLGGLLHHGAEQVTRLDTQGFVDAVRANWDILDPQHTGRITKEAIQRAEQDPVYGLKNAFMLKVLDQDFDKLKDLSNDDWGSEKGISKADIDALALAKQDGTGFSSMEHAVAHDFHTDVEVAGAGAALRMLTAGKVAMGTRLAKAFPVGVGLLAAGTIYGAADYYLNRKDNLDSMLKELG